MYRHRNTLQLFHYVQCRKHQIPSKSSQSVSTVFFLLQTHWHVPIIKAHMTHMPLNSQILFIQCLLGGWSWLYIDLDITCPPCVMSIPEFLYLGRFSVPAKRPKRPRRVHLLWQPSIDMSLGVAPSWPSEGNNHVVIINWLVVWNIWIIFSICWEMLGMSSSQLTFIFFRGVGTPPSSIWWYTMVYGIPLRCEIWWGEKSLELAVSFFWQKPKLQVASNQRCVAGSMVFLNWVGFWSVDCILDWILNSMAQHDQFMFRSPLSITHFTSTFFNFTSSLEHLPVAFTLHKLNE